MSSSERMAAARTVAHGTRATRARTRDGELMNAGDRSNAFGLSLLSLALAACTSGSGERPKPMYAAIVPASIMTPDSVDTRIGTLTFVDGIPDAKTTQRAYDQLDFSRGIETFLTGIAAASVQALKQGFIEGGFGPSAEGSGIGITEDLANARALFLTPNTTVVYGWFCVDLEQGPVVVQVPPGVLGIIDDAFFRFVSDVGMVGPDKGQGGKYLLVPPGYGGAVPTDGYFVLKPRTYTNLVILRSFVKEGDLAGTVKNLKDHSRAYPLAAAANPPAQKFVDISKLKINTVHANDFHFYEELDAVVQHEPADFIDPETVGLFASIGIKKGVKFAPDARMKALLVDAVAVGNATARALTFAPRDERTKFFPDRQWYTTFYAGGYAFELNGERTLDSRAMFHYYATGITPAMTPSKPGVGATYAIAARDAQGNNFDGGKTYQVTLPAPVPAANFWSFTIYDNQHRSFLETDQKLAGLDSTLPGLKKNADGSVTVYFAPTAPAGQEGNWVQTIPGKGWNALLRLYGPLEAWFDRSWKPGDFELVK